MHDLTGHALYADFASSYSGGSLTPALFLLRDVYLRYGPSGINQVGCFADRSGVFFIPDVNLFSESLFQLAGFGRGVETFVVEGVTGLIRFAKGSAKFALDVSIYGALGDVLDNVNILSHFFQR